METPEEEKGGVEWQTDRRRGRRRVSRSSLLPSPPLQKGERERRMKQRERRGDERREERRGER